MITKSHLTSRSYAKIRNNNKLDICAIISQRMEVRPSMSGTPYLTMKSENIQAAGIVIHLHCGTKLVIASVYSPPKHKITSCQYAHFFNHLQSKWIIGDEFNAQHPYWGSRITTTKGQELRQSIVTINASCLSNCTS